MRIKGRICEVLRKEWLSIVVVIAFLVVAAIYSVITPIFEAPDEIQHYFYVKYLADERVLPVLTMPAEEAFQQEGSQPPLYYLLGALATFWIDTNDALSLLRPNPYANVGVPLALGNKNVVIHTAQEAFPFRGAVLAIHLVRFLSVLLGAVTVLSTYLLTREIFPQDKALALGAASINAFIPQFLFISGAVNNDGAVAAASSVVLLLVVRLMKAEPNWKRYLRLGLVLGAAALTKLSGLGLVVVALAGLLIVAMKRRSPRVLIEGGAIILLSVLLIAGWWYLRNWSLYGDPTALNMHLAIMGAKERPLTLSRFLYEMEGFKTSFWALFGWFNVLAGSVIYRFFDLLTLVALLGLIWVIIKGLRGEDHSSFQYLTPLLLWLPVLAVSFYSWMAKTPAAQGRLAFPAISVISLLLFWGLSQFVPQRHTELLAVILAGTLLAMAIISPFRYIAPAYARPRLLSPDELEAVSNRLDISFGHKMRLLGYAVDRETIAAGESLTVTLYWQSEGEIDRDYSIFVHLLDEVDAVVAQADSHPGMGTYPTSEWAVGDAIAEEYILRLPETAFAPSPAIVEVGLYDYSTGKRLLAYSTEGQPMGDNVRFHPVSIEGASPRGQPVGVFVSFENVIALVAYQVDRRSVKPGESLELTLYWRALVKPSADYTVFTHLLGPDTQMWAQHDGPPKDGRSPTSAWKPDQLVEDRHTLTVAADTPPGVYEIEVGLYSPATGERLLVLGDRDQVVGDGVLLMSVRVAD